MKGARLLKVLAFFQMLSDPGQREVERVVDASQEAQNALGGRVPRNTLSNAFLKLPAGIRAIKSDQTVSLPGWAGDVILRLVVYQLTDGKIIRVLTSRHDLSTLSIAMLYKKRWSIEKWWRWLKRIYKVKEPLGESENALPLQIVAAFVTDLVLRAFKHCGGFKGTLYDFVKTCREIALIPISGVIGRMRQALMATAVSLELLEASPQGQT
jgi:hypothetical protein